MELQNVHNACRVRLILGIFSFTPTPVFAAHTNQNQLFFLLLERGSAVRSALRCHRQRVGRYHLLTGYHHVLARLASADVLRYLKYTEAFSGKVLIVFVRSERGPRVAVEVTRGRNKGDWTGLHE